MTHDEPTTFSVEVLAFPGAADGAELASCIADAFGIPSDDARRLVDSAPVEVKKGADADTTREIAKVLLGLGAEICIRNEKTGEEKIHRSTSAPNPERVSSVPPAASSSRPAPLSPSRGRSVPPARSRPPGPLSYPPSSSRPPPSNEPVPDSAALIARAAEAASARPPPMDVCGACSRRIEKGEGCASCGWSNEHKRRFCKECHREINPVARLWPQRVATQRALLGRLPLLTLCAVGLAAGAAAFYFFGIFPAGAIVALTLLVLFALLGATTQLRCEPCRRSIERFQLQPAERKSLAASRRRWFLAAVLSLLVGIGFAMPVFGARPELVVDSFGIGWSAPVPWSHRELERRLATVPSDGGPTRLTIRRAFNPSFQVSGFYLLHTMLPEGRQPKLDDPALARLMESAVQTAAPGAQLGSARVIETPSGPAREATLSGNSEGRAVGGRVRALLFERDLVLILFMAGGGDPANAPPGLAFLDSLRVHRGP